MNTQKEEQKALGPVGERIVSLSRESSKEILARWDESTMEKIKANGEIIMQQAKEFEIVDKTSFDLANEKFVGIAQYKKDGGEFIEPLVEATRNPWSLACDIRRLFYDPADAAKAIFEKKIADWKVAERKRAEAEQIRVNNERKAREEAERKKLEEKARIEREKAEQARREAEQRAAVEREKAEQARREKEKAEARRIEAENKRREAEQRAADAIKEADEAKAAQARAESERLKAEENAEREKIAQAEREAFKAEQDAKKEIAKGEAAAAEREMKANSHKTMAETTFVAPTVVLPTVQKTETTKLGKAIGRKTWEVTIIDEMEIVCSVVAGVENGGFPISVLNLEPDKIKAALKRWAKMSLTLQTYEANGVIIEATESLSARSNSKKEK